MKIYDLGGGVYEAEIPPNVINHFSQLNLLLGVLIGVSLISSIWAITKTQWGFLTACLIILFGCSYYLNLMIKNQKIADRIIDQLFDSNSHIKESKPEDVN